MAKNNQTLEIFANNLDDELVWRKQELTTLKNKIPTKKNNEQTALLRANYVMLYAHWEGFIKSIFQHYIEYVKQKQLPLKKLKPCFIARIIRSKGASEKGISQEVRKIEYIISELENRAYLTDISVSTKSNLKFSVFEDILVEVGLSLRDIEPISTHFNTYIDTSLIKTEINNLVIIRNEVAHGKRLSEIRGEDGKNIIISYESFIRTREITMDLIENIKQKLYQAAAQEKYKN